MKIVGTIAKRKRFEADVRRQAIIKVVRKLVKQGGLQDVSLRRVAELAGVSTTVVYSVFADKATLIAQAIAPDLLELTKQMAKHAQAQVQPLDRIRSTGRAYIEFGLKHPAQYMFIFMQLRPHAVNEAPPLTAGDASQDPYAFGRSLWVQLASTGVVRGDEASIELMTQIFWHGIHGYTARQLVMGPDDPWLPQVPEPQGRDLLIEALLSGILAQFKAT